ncbi:unannotated protein [freshwater metagenome]|uniref:Unannotated protein n=1 Tax=freshwater metagenome TaxID=449393 RepID=A0A6J5Z3F8_9ZZZZ|nr:hypothetical protein [Actinomycetota bacterium]MSX11179.1 hypothetical protein [Actinomycetota bacterium]
MSGAAADPVELPRPRMARGDWLVLFVFAAMAVAPLIGLLVRVWTQGGVITGADGFLVTDPMQYVNWLRQSGESGAAANLYDLAPGPHSFVHPGLFISGLLYRLGFGVVLAYLVWKPVAILALFAGAFLFSARFLTRTGDRRVAVILGLFFASPIAAAVGWASAAQSTVKFNLDFVSGELWTGTYLWGYLFTAVGVGLMPLGLLAFERARRTHGVRPLLIASSIGLIASWCQPWQGATFALILIGASLMADGRDRAALVASAKLLAPVLLATAAPLVYYFLLSKYDPSWRLAGEVNNFGRWPWWVTVVGIAPLAIPALFAYRIRALDFGDWMLRIWPVAGLIIFYLPVGTFPFHAFQGIALPLAILAMVAVRSWLGARPLPLFWAAVVVAFLVVPGTIYRADQMRGAVKAGRQAFFLEPGERDALRWIERQPGRGGVLSPVPDGAYIPAYTGREVWAGAGSWTPDFGWRGLAVAELFNGIGGADADQALVVGSGARFVYASCRAKAGLDQKLAPITLGPVHNFGCARVWEIRPPAGGWK